MAVFRDIFQRKTRSLLTISGIAVGVFALVVLGAMSEKANSTMEMSGAYYADKVIIAEQQAANDMGYSSGIRPLELSRLDAVREVPGVRDVAPQVAILLDPTKPPLGMPPLLVGGYLGTDRYTEQWRASEGRMLTDEETGVAVVGSDLVEQLDARVGEIVAVRDERYEVVGILDRSYTTMDQSVMISLPDAQVVAAGTLPDAFAEDLDPASIALQATVYAESGTDADSLARSIEREVDGIKATGPAQLRRNMSQTVYIFDGILAGLGTLALLVGGLAIVNTMTMAVTERTREMGIKRALGASGWRVARDVLSESIVLGTLGGLIGIIVGAIAAQGFNAAAAAQIGYAMFAVTGRLLIGALGFAVVLGVMAGVYPAWYAARTDPVDALAYE